MKERSMILQTPRLTLRSLSEQDREGMIGLLTDETIKKTYMIPDFADRQQTDAYFDRLRSLSEAKDRFIYGIYLGTEVIGFLNECGKDERGIELGYFIAPRHWNRGYATEALRAAMDELFRMGYERVTAGFFEENPASGRVMEKAGMRPTARESAIEYRGKVHRCLYREAVGEDSTGAPTAVNP